MQSWAIKDLILAAKLCHTNCETCFGATDSDCLSCAAGFYLQGNVCLNACNPGYYTISDQRLCSQTCPSGYYALTSNFSCLRCSDGCLVCTNTQICQAWADNRDQNEQKNGFTSKLEFWILLIVVLVLLAVYIAYRCVRKRCRKEEEEEEVEVTN